MKPHKWAKEIKAWADGAEIEYRKVGEDEWIGAGIFPAWSYDQFEYRIKPQPSGCLACVTCGQLVEQPQPKEPKYLLAWEDAGGLHITSENNYPITSMTFLGKIKLEIGE